MIKLWNKIMRGIYDWMMKMSKGPRAIATLCVISFVESSFFPIPPDILLIPLILANREKAFRIALYTTIASVLGGVFGYAIGYYAYTVIEPHLSAGFIDKIDWFSDKYNTFGAWVVFFAGVTPFPYKIITIASGVTHLDFTVFMVSSFLARGLRFFLIAILLWKWGVPMKVWIEKNLGWLSVLAFILLVGGFLMIKWM